MDDQTRERIRKALRDMDKQAARKPVQPPVELQRKYQSISAARLGTDENQIFPYDADAQQQGRMYIQIISAHPFVTTAIPSDELPIDKIPKIVHLPILVGKLKDVAIDDDERLGWLIIAIDEHMI